MADNEIVIEIEPAGDTTPTPLLQSSQTREWDTKKPSWSEPLRYAIYDDNWEAVKEILDNEPEAINGPVGQGYDTPLVVAVQRLWPRGMRIVENLINMTMPPEKLVYSKEEIGEWKRPMSAIHCAADNGSFIAVKLLITKYPAMLNSLDWYKKTPIQRALKFDRTELACYMLKLGLTLLPDQLEFELTLKKDLEFAIKERRYDFAYTLIQQCPKLAWDLSPWKLLIEECKDLPYRSQLNMWQSIIYPWIHMDDEIVSNSLICEWEKANTRFLLDTEIQSPKHQYSIGSPLKSVRMLKLKHYQALQVVRGLCMEIYNSYEYCGDIVQSLFWMAIHNGMFDIVQMILKTFPGAIEYKDDNMNNALQYAVSHRDGKTFNVIHEEIKGGPWDDIRSSVDDKKNNLLHLVAKRARRNRLGIRSEKVIQLQREFQWYKEMENILPSHLKFEKNEEDCVPLEVFDQYHENMIQAENEWLTSMSNSCMVAGSLIAAVAFAAAITLPGGNNDDNGLPKFSKEWAFQIFAFSDAFALVSSLTTVMTFLSIFITRDSIESFQYDLPNRLIFGLISLFLSVTFLMMSFMTTIYLLFADHYKWITYPTIVVSFGPILFSSYLQLPSLLNIIKSTYGPNIFHDHNVTVFNRW